LNLQERTFDIEAEAVKREREIFSALQKNFSEFALFMFGDHGMVKVERQVDAEKEIAGMLARTGLSASRFSHLAKRRPIEV